MERKTIASRRVGNVVIHVHSETNPSDTEWDALLGLYRPPADVTKLCTLVFTAGGAPNASQRAKMNTEFSGHAGRTAVLTGSVLARAAGTAVSWFRPQLRIFGPDDTQQAFQHLNVDADTRAMILLALAELKAELNIGPRRVVA